MSFIDYLTQKGVIDSKEAESLLQKEGHENGDAVEILSKQGMDKQHLMELKSEYFNMPTRTVETQEIPLNTLKLIPEESARHYQFAPIAFEDDVLTVGMVDPDNLEARDALQFISSKLNIPFKFFLISYSDFATLMENYKGLSGEVNKALSDLEGELSEVAASSSSENVIQNLEEDGDFSFRKIDENANDITSKDKKKVKATANEEDVNKKEVVKEEKKTPIKEGGKKGFKIKIVEDTPVTKIVAVLLRHATEGGASDVHIEPTSDKIKVRFRVDGVLYTSLFLPKTVHNSVVARIKVLANLKLDEKRKPQDGSFSARIEDRKIDFRVSTFPTHYGEKVVLRILDSEKGVTSLDGAGLDGPNLKLIMEAIKKPFGLILLTGPTGSGKSTTLYAMLGEVDREKKNVVSLEDPIEYNIDGISQSQVRPEIGYTFANGLRSILRQDPDVIMVGEIRDKETAQLAIQAALTGHLVFSTLHTNNAAGVVPRLVDMGIDPYLIAPTLLIAVGQRLVPRICEPSKKAVLIDESIAEMIKKQFEDIPESQRSKIPHSKEVYEAVPSSECPGGTHGRIGIFEILSVDKEMEKVILENPTEGAILNQARKGGMFTMREDALFKSFKGIVSFREVNKFE